MALKFIANLDSRSVFSYSGEQNIPYSLSKICGFSDKNLKTPKNDTEFLKKVTSRIKSTAARSVARKFDITSKAKNKHWPRRVRAGALGSVLWRGLAKQLAIMVMGLKTTGYGFYVGSSTKLTQRASRWAQRTAGPVNVSN